MINFPRNICTGCADTLEEILMFIENTKNNDARVEIQTIVKIERGLTNDGATVEGNNEDINLHEYHICRICSSPSNVTRRKEETHLNQLIQSVTNIEVKAEIFLCDSCVDKLENISSFITSSLYNEEKLRSALTRTGFEETENYLNSIVIEPSESRDLQVERTIDRNEFAGEMNFKREIADTKEEYSIDVKEEMKEIELPVSSNPNFPGKSKLPLEPTTERPFQCDFCKRCFTHKNTLKNHIITGSRSPSQCHLCQKTFPQKCQMEDHLLFHAKESPFECIFCKNRFAERTTLKEHLLTHTISKSHQCLTCKKQFASKNVLKKHLLIHFGEKKHECNICGKKFVSKSLLQTHLRSHNEKHICEVCKKCFTVRGTLERHLLTHTGERPFECDRCQKRFSQKETLKRHMRTHVEKN
nr:zinc finger protein 449-like [Leptinotarsa decemlineata]